MMSFSMKNVAIVGLGRWGKNLLREFSRISNIEICHSTGNVENIEWLRKNFPKVKHTKNFHDVLNNNSIDAVVISTPIKTHFHLTYQALLAGKHVFIEKPMAENSSYAKKLILLAKEKKVLLFVGHVFLYHPVLEKVRAINSKESINYLKFSWTKLGSFKEDILLDLLSHFISIIIELLGTPQSLRIIDIERIVSSYDIVTMEFRFNKGRKCIVDINRASNFKKRSITIVTAKNVLEWEDDILYKFNKKTFSYDLILNPKKTPLTVECETFIDSLNKRINYMNADKALKIIQLVEKCKKMIEK